MRGKKTSSAKVAPLPHPKNSFQRILLVDGEPLLRQINTEVLIKSGYHVDATEDGEVAWLVLNTDRYDLVITDNDLPNVSGVDLLKKLHAARMTLPVIMVAGIFPQDEFTRSPWLRPVAALPKDCTPEEFLGTVQAVLRATTRDHEPCAGL
jgi:DNA-binding response OmpR family regulator